MQSHTTEAAVPKPMPRAQTQRAEPVAEEQEMLRDALADAESASAQLAFRVFTSLSDAETVWRQLEAEAVLSPYQRFDWVSAIEAARGRGKGRLAIGVIEQGNQPVALLALDVVRRGGVAIATQFGSDIGNVGWIIMTAAFAPSFTPAVLNILLGEMGRRVGGIDLFTLFAQPKTWQGLANPLLANGHQTGPDSFYFSTISGESGLGRLNAKRIRNITRGKRRLEEQFGAVSLRTATTPTEIDQVHAAFLKQRGQRFQQMGVRNVFADAWFVRFFRDAAISSLAEARPALRFHALWAGDEIVATSCGTYSGTHFSQFINSTTEGPAAKYSLMGLMMYEMVQELEGDGIASLDMGLGDFDYKTDWTDPVEVFDAVIPVTPLGRIAAPALRKLRQIKRAIKHNDKLFDLLKRLRALTLKSEKRDAS